MQAEQPYTILAFYAFVAIEDPHLEEARHKEFFSNRDICGRIYISEEGINAQMSAANADAEAYMAWLKSDERFENIHFKLDPYPEHVFAKMTVKYRNQLAAMDTQVDTKQGGEHVSPELWKEMIESDEEYLMLDVRNDYEWDIGHFAGAERPEAEAFRDFPEYTRRLRERLPANKTKVMMYCTGGIRCELYSAQMKEEGFEEIYQLNGGVINYGHKVGNKHWDGKLFVFDDRMSVPISDDPHTVVGHCSFCDAPADHPYNCANMDCNELFLSCMDCLNAHQGCCGDECVDAPRVRSLDHQLSGKPFRKWYNYS